MNEAKNFLGTPINRTENKIIIKKQFYNGGYTCMEKGFQLEENNQIIDVFIDT